MTKQILPGMFDLVPSASKDSWRASHLWNHLEATARDLASLYGFSEVRTPILEKSSLFERSSGESSDIVSKELYRFIDKGDRALALRPEGTAALLRAYVEETQNWQKKYQKFYYIAPMFRYDRPQAGRFRQHHQFGTEILGQKSPEIDAELIDFLITFLEKIGITSWTLRINSLGTPEERKNYLKNLVAYYEKHADKLSEDSQKRLTTNPLRILDAKDPTDQSINQKAPTLLESLGKDSRDYFEAVQKWLQHQNIPFTIDPLLVRGLDYYNHTVFEVVTTSLGAQNSIGGGGRYDGLVKAIGGPDIPGIGFGIGLERALQTALSQTLTKKEQTPSLYIIPMGEDAKQTAFSLAKTLRQENISVEIDWSEKKVGKCLQLADLKNATYALILGSQEIETGQGKLKQMATGKETEIPLKDLPSYLSLLLHSPKLLQQWQALQTKLASPLISNLFLEELSHDVEATSKELQRLQHSLENLKQP